MKNKRYVMKVRLFFKSINTMQFRFEYILICVIIFIKHQIIKYASACSIVVE